MSTYASLHFTNGCGGGLDALKVKAWLVGGRLFLDAQTEGLGAACLTFSGEPAEVARLLARMQDVAGAAVADARLAEAQKEVAA